MPYREIIAVCSQIHTELINALCVERRIVASYAGGIYSDHGALEIQISVIKTSQLTLYSEIIALCSQIHTKHINTVWAEGRIV